MAVDDSGPEQITTTTILLVLSTVFVGLRFWARHNVAAKYGLDDWLIVAGQVSTHMPSARFCDRSLFDHFQS